MQGLITFLIVPCSSWELLVKCVIDRGGRFVPEGGQDPGFTYTLSAVWRINGNGVGKGAVQRRREGWTLNDQVLGKGLDDRPRGLELVFLLPAIVVSCGWVCACGVEKSRNGGQPKTSGRT